jgi:hypothetical protein
METDLPARDVRSQITDFFERLHERDGSRKVLQFTNSAQRIANVSQIDWGVELRKIERQFEGLPPEPTRTQIRLQKIQDMVERERFDERLALVGIWVRLVLVGALAAALYWWPYGRDCGFPLVAFLVSQSMVIVGGLSLAIRTWRDRLVWPFLGSALFIISAWTVLALQTFPRLGYSMSPPTSVGWSCR